MDDKTANVFIKGDNQYSVIKLDGSKAEMSGKDIIATSFSEAKEAATKALSRKGR